MGHLVVVFEFVLIIVFVSVVITDFLRFIHRHLTVVIVPSSFPPINLAIQKKLGGVLKNIIEHPSKYPQCIIDFPHEIP